MAFICLGFTHQESSEKRVLSQYYYEGREYTIEHLENPIEQLTSRLIISLLDIEKFFSLN